MAKATTMTERRSAAGLPAHVLVMLGASTAGYAAILAGVAGLQSHADAALIAAQAPATSGAARLIAGHDALQAALDAARAGYDATAQAYASARPGLDALEGSLADLATTAAQIDGVSRSLPARALLPSVRQAAGSRSAPPTHSTTGASGG